MTPVRGIYRRLDRLPLEDTERQEWLERLLEDVRRSTGAEVCGVLGGS